MRGHTKKTLVLYVMNLTLVRNKRHERRQLFLRSITAAAFDQEKQMALVVVGLVWTYICVNSPDLDIPFVDGPLRRLFLKYISISCRVS